ncbi:efflux transporter outer membrane subunit [Roseateles terrae]|uniref:Multidrug efflux system outer membrane protein n=1 Tax=Roseateles terrae TaxID=431060 RepID=A0ABR6GTY4_9BURK|nr:efflux transporter outer membrane subunit [Roseateles terrae]MBB3195562.1 multidrug efflux system outer membrane protein [Roseateles terrae]OWQ86475.1 RND transporter [Roseateles terrae]
MKLMMTTLLAALVLAGCATPPPIDESRLPATPAAFKTLQGPQGSAPVADGRWAVVPPSDAEPRGDWWLAFGDAQLNDLEQRALRNNTDLQSAAARLAQARALSRSADADRLPQVGANAGAYRGTTAGQGPAVTPLYRAGLTASWEADLSGRLTQASRAARLDTQAREALLQSTRLMVQADVAQTYLSLRFTDQERRLVRDTVAAYRETLALTQRRYQAGDVAELDLARVQAEVASTEAEAVALDRRRAQLENALAVLLGEPASGFSLAEAQDLAALPAIPAGLPSAVLARRPDVAAAQRSLLAAQARVGVAQAAWFPSLALTATGGYASPELSDVFKWSARAWSVDALLSLPLFDGGRRKAGIESAQAGLDLAMADYRQQLLQALREVEDSLSGLQLLSRQSEVQAQAVDAASRATALSDARYRNGFISQLDLLDARRSELRNRRVALQVQAEQYQATVGLVRALGGGWTPAG